METNTEPGRRLKLAIGQIEASYGDMVANLAKHLDMMAAARAGGADVLLFPELSLTGYCVGEHSLSLAIPRDHEIIGRLAEASKDIWTVVGFIEEGVAAQIHNSVAVLRNGEIAFLHRKLNLATFGKLEEGKHFAGGRYLETFNLGPRWRAGTLICADSWNPALVHLAAVQGATLLLMPVASALGVVGGEFSNPIGWQRALDFYAMVYGMPLAMANFAGNQNGAQFWGGSRVLDPYGNCLAQAGDGEDLIFAELDFQAVLTARYHLPTLRDSNLDLIYRELGRLTWQVGVPPESRRV
ncbi:MAG: nitrilase-related carbon-nitrogen hydrolase [Kiloniellaceae bacterium]